MGRTRSSPTSSQTGDKITGEMYDQITDRSEYLDDFVEMIGKDIAYETRRRLQQMIRRFGTETVQNSRLPDTSDIQGRITGSHVQFTKTYRGAMEITWTVGEKQVASLPARRAQGSILGSPRSGSDVYHGKVDHQAKGAARLVSAATSTGQL